MLQRPYTNDSFVVLKLKIQVQHLKTVGAKRLYEFLKDWEFRKEVYVKFDDLKIVLNLNDNIDSNKTYATVNRNHLKKAINEINGHSDIDVSYETIKEKIKGKRTQVTKIKFFINKQSESRLQYLGLIEESITSHMFYNKSKLKMDKWI